MSKPVIEINNLGKQYRLGEVGVKTISDDFKRWLYKVRGKEDPFLKVGDENDRTQTGGSDYVWALKDINFKVNQGDVVGIIGKNGAGKSTLLKILSRTTSPTVGEYKIKGRVTSLLEVGTGFHPDLTGRDNVFLNGAILGMSKAEIKKNFDEIVAFSGVERYIDTPVKRYSSGMYVRLAFAVAAHLESEILIVDEVLAVGDIDFQKKCMGKMEDVSGKQGRTILFVSHNMAAVKSLCSRGLMLKNGVMNYDGDVSTAIDRYFYDGKEFDNSGIVPEERRTYNSGEAKFTHAYIVDEQERQADELYFKQKFKVKMVLEVNTPLQDIGIWICLVNSNGEKVTFSCDGNQNYAARDYDAGTYEMEIAFETSLMPNRYSISANLFKFQAGASVDLIESSYFFNISTFTKNKEGDYPWQMVMGYVEPKTNWNIRKLETVK